MTTNPRGGTAAVIPFPEWRRQQRMRERVERELAGVRRRRVVRGILGMVSVTCAALTLLALAAIALRGCP